MKTVDVLSNIVNYFEEGYHLSFPELVGDLPERFYNIPAKDIQDGFGTVEVNKNYYDSYTESGYGESAFCVDEGWLIVKYVY